MCKNERDCIIGNCGTVCDQRVQLSITCQKHNEKNRTAITFEKVARNRSLFLCALIMHLNIQQHFYNQFPLRIRILIIAAGEQFRGLVDRGDSSKPLNCRIKE